MYYLFLIGKIIAVSLPRRATYQAAKFFALLRFYFSRADRLAVLYNLKPLVEDKRKRIEAAKGVFVNFAYYLVDFFRYSKLNLKFIEKYVNFEGLEIVDKLAAQKQGAILVTAHLGNYELGGAVMALSGYPLSVVALPHLDLRTNNFFNNQRKKAGMQVIPTGLSVKESIAVLKNGRFLALLGDRDFSQSGRKEKMFSRYAYIPRGMAFLARKSQSAVVPAFFIRENKYFYRLIFEKEINFNSADFNSTSASQENKNNENFEKKIIQKYIIVLEKYLKKYPEQWYMFQKYWR